MGDVIVLPVIRVERYSDTPSDGGKARIQQRRARLGLNEPFRGEDDSLVMLRADETQMPCDCA